jgi:hypothetical protein
VVTARDEREGVSGKHGRAIALGAFLSALALVATRCFFAFANPQFYIEDGTFWYAEAHERGAFRALLLPFYRGYLVTAQRIGGALAQAVPFAWAPLVMSVLAIAVYALPAGFIASGRFASVLPRRGARLLAALLYVALPGAWTTMANATHTQWHLALLAALVVVALPPATRADRVFDVAVCALSGLSGPTAILLTPVAALAWWLRRTRWSLVLAGVTAATAAIQAAFMLSAPHEAGGTPLGASVLALLKLFTYRVVLGTFVGDAGLSRLLAHASTAMESTATILLVALAGAAIAAAGLWRGTVELRLLLLFAALVFLAALLWPPSGAHSDVGYWEQLTAPGSGNRYFLLSSFALICSLATLAFSARSSLRAAGWAGLAAILAVGVPLNWVEPPLRDYGFAQYAAKYERAAPGERVQVITPPGWSFVLTKR